MRTLVILVVLAGSGCFVSGDYQRVRDENVTLRAENDSLRRRLIRAAAKLEMIDRIIHDEVPGNATSPGERATAAGEKATGEGD
jgi:hypothetical protein